MPTLADVMTPNPAFCTPGSTLAEAARMMRDGGFGVVPVVESAEAKRLVGVITDRDIVVRGIAMGRDPGTTRVEECMTGSVQTLPPDASLEQCRGLMEGQKIRRVPVVDGAGILVGMVSIGDLSDEMPTDRVGATLAEISERDTRQLYSEVLEDNQTGTHVTPVDDPASSHRVSHP